PQLKETLKAQLQQEQAKYQISGELSTVELEQLLTSEAATLADVTKKLDKLEADAKARNDRKPELAGKLEESKKNLAGNEQTLADNTPSADPPAVQLSRKTEQEAYSIYLKQLIAQFPVEQSYYTTMSEIFLQQKD